MPAAALAAGAAVGGLLQADAASSAARTQANAAGRGIDEQRRQFDLTRSDQLPWLTQGRAGLYKLSDLLGIDTPQGAMPTRKQPTREQFTTPATVGRLVQPTAGVSVIREAGTPAYFNEGAYNQALQDWQASSMGRSSAMGRSSEFGSLMDDFTGADLVNEPGYQFGLDQGQRAVDQSAAARGSLLSGKTLRDLVTFGQDYGGTKFGEAFNRDAANKSRKFSMLSGLSGIGQNTATNLGQAGMQSAGNISDLLTSQGAASAAGTIGQANAISGTIGNLSNLYMQNQYLDALRGGSRTGNVFLGNTTF